VITHPDKVLFPEDGITKGELASYYDAVADFMLPHVAGRPVTLERYPSGIGQKGFWQKNVAGRAPEWLERVSVPKKGGSVRYPLVSDRRALLWAANLNTITLHVWTSRTAALQRPDLCVFDLDPPEDDAPGVRAAALAVRDLLAELELPSFVKTTGSKGFHVVVPLDGEDEAGEVARFAHAVGARLVERQPQRFTQEFYKADRAGRILVVTGRNGFGATFAAAYSVRARRGAPVSAPCTWEEIERAEVGPRSLTLRTLPARLARVGDLWAELPLHARSLRAATSRLGLG
jgi:bifunctional non-homologous end joining protein LigD